MRWPSLRICELNAANSTFIRTSWSSRRYCYGGCSMLSENLTKSSRKGGGCLPSPQLEEPRRESLPSWRWQWQTGAISSRPDECSRELLVRADGRGRNYGWTEVEVAFLAGDHGEVLAALGSADERSDEGLFHILSELTLAWSKWTLEPTLTPAIVAPPPRDRGTSSTRTGPSAPRRARRCIRWSHRQIDRRSLEADHGPRVRPGPLAEWLGGSFKTESRGRIDVCRGLVACRSIWSGHARRSRSSLIAECWWPHTAGRGIDVSQALGAGVPGYYARRSGVHDSSDRSGVGTLLRKR